jgi:hypothetical protein
MKIIAPTSPDLVAAAPEMYATLKVTDEKLTKLIYDLENRVDAKSIALLVSWQDDVRAILAKARGDVAVPRYPRERE